MHNYPVPKTKPNVYRPVLWSPSLWPPTIIFFTFWFISGISYSWNHNLFVTGIPLGTVLPSFAHVCRKCRRFSSLRVSASSAPVAHSCLSARLSVTVLPFGYYEWCLLWVWCIHILSVWYASFNLLKHTHPEVGVMDHSNVIFNILRSHQCHPQQQLHFCFSFIKNILCVSVHPLIPTHICLCTTHIQCLWMPE